MSITEGMKVIEIANFYELARRTLGRKQNDKRAIPQDYLAALRRFTETHPDWTNFVVDLDMQGGVVTCGSCDESFPAGRQILPGVFRFKDLTALEEHVQTSAHKHMAGDNEKLASRHVSSAPYKLHRNGSKSISNPQTPSHPRTNARVLSKSLGEIEPPSTSDVEPLSSDIEREGDPASFPRAPSVIELSSSSDDPEPVGKFLKKYTFPDGEVIVIESSDEEDAPTQQVLNSMVSTPRPAQHFGSANTPRPGPSAAGPSSAPRAPGPFPLRNTASQRSWSQYRARDQSAESVRSASVSTGAGSVSSRKRSVQYPDEEFGETEDSADDGAARYWAEAEGRFGKRVRYETDPEDEMADEEEVDDEGMYDGDMYDEDETTAGHGRNRANTLMPGHFPPPTPVPAYQAAADNTFNLPSLEALRQQMDPTNRLFNDALVMPFASGSNIVHPNLGYRAQPMMGPMPVPTTIGSASQRYNHGFNLNYDDKSPTTWIDFDGPNHAKQLQRFFDEAMDEHEGAIPVQDAAKALGLSSTTERLPGMQVVLMPHQLIGVSWMIKQELGKVAGGILADDMGLGKTMQTVALISKNRPDKSNPRKSTLIVAPAALLDQWKQEIIDRTDDNLFKIRVHHGKDKLRSVNDVKKYDIIITTFQTLTNEFPADETDLRKKKSENKKKKSKQGTLDHFIVDSSDEERSSKKKTGNLGPLASTKWFRVVVDEAQNIRNRATRSSRVMSLLDAEYRWALTGTPVTNSLADLYGLVRYLHFSPFNDWAEFNERIARIQKRDPKLAGQRAQALLKKCLLRRTKDSKLDGKPLITLPPKTIDILELEFSPDERQIYAAVEARQQQKMNKFIREGTVMKNYSAILVMILRLRQVCNHPQLIAYAAGEFAPEGAHAVLSEDGEPNSVAASKPAQDAYSTTRAKAIMGDEKFELTMRQFRDTAEEMITAELSGGNIPSDDTIECSVCFEPYVGNARVTSCGHVFCASCLLDLFKQGLQGEVAGNEQFGAGRQFAGQEVRPCPKCRGEITISRILPASIFEPSDKEKDEIKRRVEAKIGTQFKIAHADADEDDDFVPTLKGKGKGKARARIEDDEDEEEADPAAAKTGDELVPGAKMIKMLELLKTWHKEAPEDKIIAYSQWTSMIDLMQILLRRDGFESLRYDGQMKREERDETLSRFKKQGGPKILLISLKCGGVGLNLTEANRVICIDLAWNAATENQAIDRAHRMGQVKPVFVKRLIVKQTIEERILNLQAEKQNLSDAALGEGKGLKMPKMNVAQLKMLFGMA